MKQGTNNEIDLLLRRLGRRADGELRPDENHLDADELSSYAENALPSAARARYTEHIADCSRCRELVVQLSSSVGLVNAEEAVKVAAPSGVKAFLASLFSPMVLRYAVPALGVLVVMLIGFAVVRRNRMAESVVQVKAPEQRIIFAVPNESPDSDRAFYDKQAAATPAAETPARGDTSSATQPAPPPNAAPVVTLNAETKPAAPEPTPQQQPAANEAPPAPKVTATGEATETVRVEAKKETTDNRSVVDLPREKSAELAKADKRRAEETETAQVDSIKSQPGTFSGLRPAARARAGVASADKDEDAAETRSVAGRNFRKQRGIWIDTAYDSSKSPTTLARASEQFRAFVADEPAIKTIADQLDGEIIVVWKGRPYRIR
jgi:hypothetical protein